MQIPKKCGRRTSGYLESKIVKPGGICDQIVRSMSKESSVTLYRVRISKPLLAKMRSTLCSFLLLFTSSLCHITAFQGLPCRRVVMPLAVPSHSGTYGGKWLLLRNSVNGTEGDDDRKRTAMINGYKSSMKLYIISSFFLLMMTGSYNKFNNAAGLVVAAGLAHILTDATEHDRLGSDTYKRVNIGLMGFNLINILNMSGELELFRMLPRGYTCFSMTAITQAVGGCTAYLGWRQGLANNANLQQELKGGIQSTFRNIWPTKGRGTIYRNALLAILVGTLITIFKLATSLRVPGLRITLYASELARLWLVATIVYSLKDAGERGRLTGNTFIQMNYLVGIWMTLSKLVCNNIAFRMNVEGLTNTVVGLVPAVPPRSGFFPSSFALVICGAAFMMGGYLNQQEKIGRLEYSSSKRRWVVARSKD